jgi:cell division protein FtsB
MLTLYQKRKIRRFLHSPLVLFFLFVLVIFLALGTYRAYRVEQEASEKREAVERELSLVAEHKRDLEARTQHLDDPRGVEEELRARYDLAKEGEQVVIMLEDEPPTTTVPEKQEEKKPWWWFW